MTFSLLPAPLPLAWDTFGDQCLSQEDVLYYLDLVSCSLLLALKSQSISYAYIIMYIAEKGRKMTEKERKESGEKRSKTSFSSSQTLAEGAQPKRGNGNSERHEISLWREKEKA